MTLATKDVTTGEGEDAVTTTKTLGAWFAEDQDNAALEAFMRGRTHQVAGTEGTFDINLFREATAMRWTYFDVPATADGVAPFTLDDVVLEGVGRFNDTRSLLTSFKDIANWYEGKVTVDVAYNHFHNENTTLDFTGNTTAVEHGLWRTKQNEWNTTDTIRVYRRSPNAQFQNQVFQTHDQAMAT